MSSVWVPDTTRVLSLKDKIQSTFSFTSPEKEAPSSSLANVLRYIKKFFHMTPQNLFVVVKPQ